ncbi:Myb/SANT-like domain [Macleaya cordata]|uniref:Myb/SANT-like domain n=1 Tax=Macleaya cordata TaxID=56857 RepID=A0A200RB89_MACCD|nr:Myb/SANT-like domain [Macleaya cordata]
MDTSSQGKGTYKAWTTKESNELLKLLVDAVGRNWRDKSGSFNKKCIEKHILPVLNEKLKCAKTDEQYLSHYKWFKKRHRSYEELLKFSSGFGWEPTTKMFINVNDEVWDNYIKSHPNHAWMRTRTCDDYEGLCIVVGNKTAIGRTSIDLHQEDTGARTCEDEDNRNPCKGFVPGSIDLDDIYNAYFPSFQAESAEPFVPLPTEVTSREIPSERHVGQKKRARNVFESTSASRSISQVDKLMENLSTGLDTVTTNINAMRGLMEERAKDLETEKKEKQKEKEKREKEKEKRELEKNNNFWVALMETPDLSMDARFKVVDLLDTKGKREMFKLFSPEERKMWVAAKMKE